LGKRASGGQETSHHKCVKDDLIKCNMSTDFQVIEGLALDKRQWLRSVDVGIKELFNDWPAERNDESYQHLFEQLLTLEQFRVLFPSQEFAYESWMEKKLGEFWQIELVESNITIRGKRSLRLLEVRQKKIIFSSLPEES
jgi:hypothetical protein